MQKVVENYILYETVGAGQYGKVYRAKNTKTNETCAIKVVPLEKFNQVPKLEEFTSNEIKTLARITNPNVIKFIEMLKTANNMYLVYEYCDGGTLEDILQRKHHLSETESLKIFKQILNAFRAIYKENILHRDLKPSNILFHNDIVKIADFGFCKKMSSSQEITFTMVGSPIYMAPEILKGYPYNIKADVWSLGVVLYEMLFGVCPYEDKTLAGLISRIDNQTLVIHREINYISQNTEGLLRKMLTLDNKQRMDWEELLSYTLSIDEVEKLMQKEDEKSSGKDNSTTDSSSTTSKTNPSNNHGLKIDIGGITTVNNDDFQKNLQHKEQIVKNLMKERNKIVFVSNLLHAILEINIISKASIISFLLLKKIVNMIDVLKRDISVENINSRFKALEKWEEFRASDEYLAYSRYLNEEQEEAGTFLVAYKQEIQGILDSITDNNFKAELVRDIPESKFFNTMLLGYAEEIKKLAMDKFKLKEENNGFHLLIHANEILDCINLDDFFEKALVDNYLRLTDQNYFTNIRKFKNDKLVELINGKINMVKNKIQN